MDKVPMTAEGYAALEAEIKNLKTVERPRIIKLIAEARTHGDLSENAEYHAAKEQQGITEARVADLEDKLSRADIIDVSKLKGDQVMFGATVTLVDEDTDDKVKYRIVGEVEGKREGGQDLHHLADRPRAAGQAQERCGGSLDAGRRQVLRGRQGRVQIDRPVCLARPQSCAPSIFVPPVYPRM